MDGIVTRDFPPGPATDSQRRALDAGSDAAALLGRVGEGDALLVAGLVPAPSLRITLTPEATTVLRASLLRIVSSVVGAPEAAVPWIHDAVLAVLPDASDDDRHDAGETIRARWHQAWQAPVTVVTATATVDASTPASVAVLLAGAQLGVAKDTRAHV